MNNELYHYGVIGMKWGVRRYQNSDGTLTELGKKKYGSSVTRVKEKHLKSQIRNTWSKESSDSAKYISSIAAKAHKAASNSKEGKELKNVSDFLLELGKEAQRKGGQLVLTKDQHDWYQGIQAAYEKKVDSYIDSYKNQIASKLLTEMGYSDTTQEGRDYVYRIMQKV